MLEVNALFLLELVSYPADDALVKIVATQMGVAVGRHDLEYAVANLENGDVERSASEVIHCDGLFRLLVEAIG